MRPQSPAASSSAQFGGWGSLLRRVSVKTLSSSFYYPWCCSLLTHSCSSLAWQHSFSPSTHLWPSCRMRHQTSSLPQIWKDASSLGSQVWVEAAVVPRAGALVGAGDFALGQVTHSTARHLCKPLLPRTALRVPRGQPPSHQLNRVNYGQRTKLPRELQAHQWRAGPERRPGPLARQQPTVPGSRRSPGSRQAANQPATWHRPPRSEAPPPAGTLPARTQSRSAPPTAARRSIRPP